MKRLLISVAIIATMLVTLPVYADEPQLYKARCTAYCLEGKTATGKDVRKGIAANPNWMGSTVIIYQRLPDDSVGDMLAILECEDQGCSEYVIDVWQPTYDECVEWMQRVYEEGCQGKIWVEVIPDAKG